MELAGGPGQALWVIEADGGDGIVLIGELLARDELVATLTPTEVAVRRKGRRQVHKSDLIDAELCARIGRAEQATLRRLVAVPGAVQAERGHVASSGRHRPRADPAPRALDDAPGRHAPQRRARPRGRLTKMDILALGLGMLWGAVPLADAEVGEGCSNTASAIALHPASEALAHGSGNDSR